MPRVPEELPPIWGAAPAGANRGIRRGDEGRAPVRTRPTPPFARAYLSRPELPPHAQVVAMHAIPRYTLAVLLAALPLQAQAPAAKRALTQADWDHWRSITGAALSNDGRWAAYMLLPQVGDAELVVRSTTGSTEYKVPRGFLGRPNNLPGGLRPPAGPNPDAE